MTIAAEGTVGTSEPTTSAKPRAAGAAVPHVLITRRGRVGVEASAGTLSYTPMPRPFASTRRDFLRWTASLGASLGLTPLWTRSAGAAPVAALLDGSRAWAREPWGTLEALGGDVWAMLSTPLADRTTLCNGGLIAGRDGVLMVEAFGTDAGARWMRERARALTRREPTHLLITHYHGDHTAGLSGAREGGAELWCSARTRDDVLERNPNPPVHLLGDAMLVPEDGARVLDLGGRRVRLVALDGHTASDTVAVVEDAGVVFTGDLVWYGMFPNFVDARPSRLARAVRRLREMDARVYVSGHGVKTDAAGLDAFAELLNLVERAAREARSSGVTAEAAGAAFRMPAAMADWTLFSPRYFERAISAWMRELSAAP